MRILAVHASVVVCDFKLSWGVPLTSLGNMSLAALCSWCSLLFACLKAHNTIAAQEGTSPNNYCMLKWILHFYSHCIIIIVSECWKVFPIVALASWYKSAVIIQIFVLGSTLYLSCVNKNFLAVHQSVFRFRSQL